MEWSDGPDFPFGYKLVSQYHIIIHYLHIMITLFSQISDYSTANTPDAAYIIGGRYTPNLVAEFRNDQWAKLDDLKKGRYDHGSITGITGTRTMIVGGYPYYEK